jgi:hypothetical protein
MFCLPRRVWLTGAFVNTSLPMSSASLGPHSQMTVMPDRPADRFNPSLVGRRGESP